MLRTFLRRAVLGSFLTAPRATASRQTDALYIGLGNRFDDDRRLVRVTIPVRHVPYRSSRKGA
jgi:hypothetical protein